jgi:acyl-ACP thioesterase
VNRGRYVFHVRSYELGPGGRSSLASLCHLLQESASLHAHALGASPAQLLEQGMTWFLARLRVRVDRYPAWRDEVTVETWPSEVRRPYAVRDFRVLEGGAAIAAASSDWLLMDVERRKPLRRIPQSILDLHPGTPERALTGTPERLPALTAAAREQRLGVRRGDLDLNGHVNHVFYVAQVEENVPPETWRRGEVRELEIELKAECHAGDDLVARSQQEGDDSFVHSLVRLADGREAARARTRWNVIPAA